MGEERGGDDEDDEDDIILVHEFVEADLSRLFFAILVCNYLYP